MSAVIAPAVEERAAGLRERAAYEEGLRAYAFGFPWVYMATLRYLWTHAPVDGSGVPSAPLNRFWHMREFADDSLLDGALPNLDAPYSVAWLDLRPEPIIFSHRDMGMRYFAFDLVGMDLVPFASVGATLTGPAARAFAIRAPDWHGRLPRDVTPLPRASSNHVLLIGRTEAGTDEGMGQAHEAQDGYRLIPLSCWPDNRLPPPSRSTLAPVSSRADPLGDWKTMNQAMSGDPPPRSLRAVDGWAHLGVGPGLQVEGQPAPVRQGLARAAASGRRSLAVHAATAKGSLANGWLHAPEANDASKLARDATDWLFPADLVRRRPSFLDALLANPICGRRSDYPRSDGRAGLETIASLIVNPAHAPVEFVAVADAAARPLRGAHAYRLVFAPGDGPPARYFWSLTLYGCDNNLLPDAAGNQTLRNRTSALSMDRDGRVTVAIQPARPTVTGTMNWLAGPADDRGFIVVLRVYDGFGTPASTPWLPPAIVRAD